MDDQNLITESLRVDTARLVERAKNTVSPADEETSRRLLQRLRRAQYRRNFVITSVMLFSIIVVGLLLMMQSGGVPTEVVDFAVLAMVGSIAVFSLVHDPDY